MNKIGSTLYLEVETKTKSDHIERFRCRVVDMSDSVYVIDYPISEETNKPSFFLDGTRFKVWFIGGDGVMYQFETEIIGRKKGNIPVLLLSNPGKHNYKRIQRRNYVRVDATLDVALHPLENEFTPFVSVTVDISGGGCAVVLPRGIHFLKEGKLKIWFALPMQSGEIEYVNAVCEIIRISQPAMGANERVSLKFIELSNVNRDKIIRYCFERQLVLRKKEGIS